MLEYVSFLNEPIIHVLQIQNTAHPFIRDFAQCSIPGVQYVTQASYAR